MTNFGSITDIQKNMAMRIQRDMNMDRTIDMLTIIQGMVTDKFGRIDKESIAIEAQFQGFTEEETEQVLKTLIRNGTLKEEGIFVKF